MSRQSGFIYTNKDKEVAPELLQVRRRIMQQEETLLKLNQKRQRIVRQIQKSRSKVSRSDSEFSAFELGKSQSSDSEQFQPFVLNSQYQRRKHDARQLRIPSEVAGTSHGRTPINSQVRKPVGAQKRKGNLVERESNFVATNSYDYQTFQAPQLITISQDENSRKKSEARIGSSNKLSEYRQVSTANHNQKTPTYSQQAQGLVASYKPAQFAGNMKSRATGKPGYQSQELIAVYKPVQFAGQIQTRTKQMYSQQKSRRVKERKQSEQPSKKAAKKRVGRLDFKQWLGKGVERKKLTLEEEQRLMQLKARRERAKSFGLGLVRRLNS